MSRLMLGKAPIIAFVAATDLNRARAFYGGKLGLLQTDSDPFALAFDAGGTELRVTRAPQVPKAPGTVLGWRVSSIEDSVRELTGRGIAFARFPTMEQDAQGIWTAPDGTRVAWFNDPDGNLLSLTERAR